MTENEITNKIIGLTIEVHSALSPGLLERIHQKNEDTKYKQDVFALQRIRVKESLEVHFDEFLDHYFKFQVVFEYEWQNKVNELMGGFKLF